MDVPVHRNTLLLSGVSPLQRKQHKYCRHRGRRRRAKGAELPLKTAASIHEKKREKNGDRRAWIKCNLVLLQVSITGSCAEHITQVSNSVWSKAGSPRAAELAPTALLLPGMNRPDPASK